MVSFSNIVKMPCPWAECPWARRLHIAQIGLFVLVHGLSILNLFDFDAGPRIYKATKSVSSRGRPEPVTIVRE